MASSAWSMVPTQTFKATLPLWGRGLWWFLHRFRGIYAVPALPPFMGCLLPSLELSHHCCRLYVWFPANCQNFPAKRGNPKIAQLVFP